MTSRGRPRDRYTEINTGENVLLNVIGTAGSTPIRNDFGEDIRQDSDASLLQRSRTVDGDSEVFEAAEDRTTSKGLFRAIITFMSQQPLIGSSSAAQATSSYGTARDHDQSSGQRAPGSILTGRQGFGDDEGSERYVRNGKGKAIRPMASFASLRSRPSRDRNDSHSRTRFRTASLRSCSPMLLAEPGHPAGQGGHLGGGLPLTTSEDEEDDDEGTKTSKEEDDEIDPADDSRYAQVRASVAATDDTSSSINTPRMWILSLLCAVLGSATNLFFSLRYPSVAITPVIALVVVHPLGRLWDQLLKRDNDPLEIYHHGDRSTPMKSQQRPERLPVRTRLRLWLAQGKWNGKEHACVYVSSNVAFGFAFATDVIVEQSKFYHQEVSIVYQLLLTISTQILGYSFAGITRRYLVRPPSMIWPGTLMSTAMFTTMHDSENKKADGWMVTRWRFFLYTWSAAFAWYFLPGLLMPALSYFSVVTWFAPDNVVVANLVRSCL